MPVAVAPVMVTLALPVLVRTSDMVGALPICTLPNPRLADCGLSVPVGTAVAVPDSAKLNALFGALLVTASVPVAAPVVVGAYVTVIPTVWFAASVTGKAGEVRVKPVPATVALEMVTLEPVALVNVSVSCSDLPD